MGDPPARIPPEQVLYVPNSTTYAVTRHIADMTPEAAQAYREIADKQFAAPAREKTKQVYAIAAGGLIVGSGALYVAATHLTGKALAVVLIAITGIFAIGSVAKQIIEALKGAKD